MSIRQGTGPLASIIIDNYNYGRFLPTAIESALQQTYPRTEVLVVDDGSTDGSREVIATYGARVIPVLKENGGQMSAFNAGFAACHGDVICFLDADDLFAPEKVAAVVRAWTDNPDAGVIYNQLQGIDGEGNRLWDRKPWPVFVQQGHIREKVERSGGWWPWPPTSGLSFARSYLERVLPGPEADFRYCADAYLAGLAPFLGPVAGVQQPLTLYRLHGHNYWQQQFTTDRAGYERKVKDYATEFSHVRTALRERLGIQAAMSLEDHYLYHYYRRRAGQPMPLPKVLFTVAKCPMLPPKARVKEAIKAGLNRI